MKRTVLSISIISLLVVNMCIPIWIWAQPESRPGNRPPQGRSPQRGRQGRQQGVSQGGPPPEALDVCQGQQAGAACQFQSPHGTISGTCQTIQNQLACVPEGLSPGGVQGDQQP